MAFNSIGDGPVETIPNQWTEEGGNTQNIVLGLDRIDRLAVERKRCRFLGNLKSGLGDVKGTFDDHHTLMYLIY